MPSDKSILQRALIFSHLATGWSTIENPIFCRDSLSTLRALQQLFSTVIRREHQKIRIFTPGLTHLHPAGKTADLGNSGTGCRILAGLLAALGEPCKITGDVSLRQRPMKRVVAPLCSAGSQVLAQENQLPLSFLGGQLNAFNHLQHPPSAQVKSMLLLAAAASGVDIRITESVQTRDHTERMLQCMGFVLKNEVKQNGISHFISQHPSKISPLNIKIPGDVGAAIFMIVLALSIKNSSITLPNVGLNKTRIACLQVLQKHGARLDWTVDGENCHEPYGTITAAWSLDQMTPIQITPELFPLMVDDVLALAVLMMQIRGKSKIAGAGELRVKESDRFLALTTTLTALGVNFSRVGEELTITGGTVAGGFCIDSLGDHRVALMQVLLGILFGGKVKGVDAIAISWPRFFHSLASTDVVFSLTKPTRG